MSSLIVQVSRIDRIQPHPNADRLELAHIKGWQCVVPRGRYAAGDLVTYVPPDSVLPAELSDRLGVTKYLSSGRVRCARLRGEPSFGLIMDVEPNTPEGTDMAEQLGITKYLPPARAEVGDALPEHPLFPGYTDVENLRNYTEVFEPGEPVVASEKIHGTNCRVGLIRESEGSAPLLMCGSKTVRRKLADNPADSLYSFPLSLPAVRALLETLGQSARQVVLFGEVYGKVQTLRYGVGNQLAFRAFDLFVNGRYLSVGAFATACDAAGIPRVPVLFEGPYALETVRSLSNGPSAVEGAANIREGVVVRPAAERVNPKVGRVILKYVGDDYLLGGGISDSNEV